MDDLTRDFASEMLHALDVIEGEVLGTGAEKSESGAALHARIFRLLHTIKGTCGFLSLPRLEALAHQGEDDLAALGGTIDGATSDLGPLLRGFDQIRVILTVTAETGREPADDPTPPQCSDGQVPHAHVSAENLEHLLADVGALGQVSAALIATARPLDLPVLRGPLQELAHTVATLESRMARATMQPIEAAWRHAPRVARQIAEAQGKSIRLEMTGGATAIDRGMFRVVRDIIVHLVRNAAGHGIESIEERRQLGKPEQGTIRLAASEQAGRIVLHVSDDGRGFDPDQPIAYGADEPVTRISGRGVGLAAAREAVDQAGGAMLVTGKAGAGADFEIELPLIVAVVPCLMVEAGGANFAMPQSALLEILRTPEAVAREGTRELLREVTCRSGTVAVVDVATHFGLERMEKAARYIAVCAAGGRRFGLLLDAVGETEALSLKPLGFASDGMRPFSAAAIADDGSVVLVLDAGHFSALAGRAAPAEAQPQAARRKVRLLSFDAGDEVPRAVRLTQLKRVCVAGLRNDVPSRLLPVVSEPAKENHNGPVLVIDGPDGDIGLPVERVGEVQLFDEQGLPQGGAREPGYATLRREDGSVVHLLNPAGHVRSLMPPPRRGVLLLEPDPFCREVLAVALRMAGHDLHVALPDDAALPDQRFAAIVADLDDDWASDVFAASDESRDNGLLRVGISSRLDGEAARRARTLSIATIVGKFDRVALRRAVAPACGKELAA